MNLENDSNINDKIKNRDEINYVSCVFNIFSLNH